MICIVGWCNLINMKDHATAPTDGEQMSLTSEYCARKCFALIWDVSRPYLPYVTARLKKLTARGAVVRPKAEFYANISRERYISKSFRHVHWVIELIPQLSYFNYFSYLTIIRCYMRQQYFKELWNNHFLLCWTRSIRYRYMRKSWELSLGLGSWVVDGEKEDKNIEYYVYSKQHK